MIIKALWISGAGIILILGLIHLLYTFFTDKFNARDSAAVTAMQNTFPVLTKETTMWKAWIGFNASHSAGAIFFGLVNILLVARYFSVIQYSGLLHILNLFTVSFYLWLGKRYWFKVPFTGICISAGCFIAVSALAFL